MTPRNRIIHSTPDYKLDARIGGNPVTLELFATYPKAQRPRAQRLVSLTLPPESFRRASEVFGDAGVAAVLENPQEAPE